MFSKVRRVVSSLLILSSVLLSSTLLSGRQTDDDIRIDLPVDGHVRVENQFGNVTAEVWKNKYVSVSASVEGSTVRFKRSPIVVDNRGKLLSISVVRTPVDPVAAIQVTVKVPDSTHLEILTTSGSIVMHGLSTSASLKTKSGDIQSVLPEPVDANISARSAGGTIKSELAASPGDGHTLKTRLGSGDTTKTLDAQTETGQISVSCEAGASPLTSTEAPVQPELVGPANAAKAAGTPASKSETEEISEGDVIRVDSQMVSLNMSVIDRSTNRGLVGLTQSDFRLFEDGQEQHIVHFESAAAPFDLVLLIDLSGSTKDVVKLIRAAALRFIDAARPSDRIAVITFAGEATVVSGL